MAATSLTCNFAIAASDEHVPGTAGDGWDVADKAAVDGDNYDDNDNGDHDDEEEDANHHDDDRFFLYCTMSLQLVWLSAPARSPRLILHMSAMVERNLQSRLHDLQCMTLARCPGHPSSSWFACLCSLSLRSSSKLGILSG